MFLLKIRTDIFCPGRDNPGNFHHIFSDQYTLEEFASEELPVGPVHIPKGILWQAQTGLP
jgi:hypothetical protein